jgi:hypothetical protein
LLFVFLVAFVFTFAVIVAVPALTPVTFPFWVTFAVFAELEDHFTLYPPRFTFFTESVVDSPATTVAFVLLSLGLDAALTLTLDIGIIETRSTAAIIHAKARFIVAFILDLLSLKKIVLF